MPLTLHQQYSLKEAIAAIGGRGSSELLCDGQFVVLPKAVLCLATIGDSATQPHVPCPSSFVWKPLRDAYDPDDRIPWLPEKAREVWGPDRKKLKQHHIFLRAPGDKRFVYAGQAHLGSFGDNPAGSGKEATFTLTSKLPRDVWLHLGGYPGWRVDLNHRDYLLDTADVAAFQKLVDKLLRRKFSHLCLTRYEEDSLTLHTNARRGWLMYLRHPADSGLYTQDQEFAGDPDDEEFFRCVCGIDLEFSAAETLPREVCARAAVEFFQTGRLPPGLHWVEG